MAGTDQFSSSLLHQLESILESDPFIDEVGFVHPSQLAALSDPSMSLEVPLENEDENDASDMAFWSRDHKLGISTHVMQPLYMAAKCAFMSSLEKYRTRINLHEKKEGFDSSLLVSIENEVMKHSKALLLLSCDFGTAWNGRKEVVVKKQDVILYLDELRFSSLVLSYSPKSERAWSHR